MVESRQTDSEGTYKFYNKYYENIGPTKICLVYPWTKKDVGTETWYARGYAKVKDINTNEIKVFYSKDIISVHK